MKLSDFVLGEKLDAAYRHVCHLRQHRAPNDDIWHLRFDWNTQRSEVIRNLRNQTFVFSPSKICQTHKGDRVESFDAIDTVVLKLIATLITKEVRSKISPHVFNLKGKGGIKGALRCVLRHLTSFYFVFKTDIAKYYASINHQILLDKLDKLGVSRYLIDLVQQHLKRAIIKMECT